MNKFFCKIFGHRFSKDYLEDIVFRSVEISLVGNGIEYEQLPLKQCFRCNRFFR